ncbi:13156_t:CDS:2 [Ambispora gerdemannii]|uniref:13156_t:CDS:1 n=1 Tax=Ambispora gerdemannii TaxID=144530 RepID=A0A9N9A2N0_9GLOM|nr:13156_t:CDS:2 [Ambispora gerdemannii]
MSTNSIKNNVSTQKQNSPALNNSLKKKNQQEEQEKRETAKPTKTNSVIDEIFATKITKHPNNSLNSQKAEISPQLPKISKRKLKQNDEDGFSDTRGTKIRKKTEDGLPIYSAEELKLNNKGGGDTSQCPFDCHCCKLFIHEQI